MSCMTDKWFEDGLVGLFLLLLGFCWSFGKAHSQVVEMIKEKKSLKFNGNNNSYVINEQKHVTSTSINMKALLKKVKTVVDYNILLNLSSHRGHTTFLT